MKKHMILLLALLLLLLPACSHADAVLTPPGEAGPTDGEMIPDSDLMPPEDAGGSPAPLADPAGAAEPEHEHCPAEDDNVNPEPEMLYCGNTVTSITLGYAGDTYSFWGDDSVALTDLLLHLSYGEEVCRCPAEYTVDTEFGSGYWVNLTNSFARCEEGQAPLTEEQVELIREIIRRNCA